MDNTSTDIVRVDPISTLRGTSKLLVNPYVNKDVPLPRILNMSVLDRDFRLVHTLYQEVMYIRHTEQKPSNLSDLVTNRTHICSPSSLAKPVIYPHQCIFPCQYQLFSE